MDRMLACGACDVGSIPTESTRKNLHFLWRFFVLYCYALREPTLSRIGTMGTNARSSFSRMMLGSGSGTSAPARTLR